MATRHRPRFRDRSDAGRQLADRMPPVVDAVVLALPRGGVPIGFEVAHRIGAPLDVLVARKLGAPMRPELGIGAIAEGGARVVNRPLVASLGISPEQLAAVTAREEEELGRRVERYRGNRPLPPMAGRTVVVVDDGLATGVTAEAAVAAVGLGHPDRVVLAVPVAAPEAVDRFRRLVDEVVVVGSPVGFGSVGEWYDDFTQTSDETVLELLDRAGHGAGRGSGR